MVKRNQFQKVEVAHDLVTGRVTE